MADTDQYELEENLYIHYHRLLEARWKTSQMLNQYRAHDSGIKDLHNLEKEVQIDASLKQRFKTILDFYYDLVEDKFQKSDIDKPGFVAEKAEELEHEELFNVQELDIEKAIILYKRCNKVLEDLGITNLEKMKRKKPEYGRGRN